MCVILSVNHHSYMSNVTFFIAWWNQRNSTNLLPYNQFVKMLAEYLGNAEAWSFLDMDVIQPGEKVFQLFHVSKLAGSAPRKVKEIITSIYNSDQDILFENIKPHYCCVLSRSASDVIKVFHVCCCDSFLVTFNWGSEGGWSDQVWGPRCPLMCCHPHQPPLMSPAQSYWQVVWSFVQSQAHPTRPFNIFLYTNAHRAETTHWTENPNPSQLISWC